MLIRCHECAGKVSTEAVACPHCGAPVKPQRRQLSARLATEYHNTPDLSHRPKCEHGETQRIAEKNHIYIAEPFVNIFQDVKSKYPEHLVIIQNGCYFEVLEQDAEYFSNLYGWKIYERQVDVPMTGFPEASNKVWQDLKRDKKPYIVVSQLPNTQRGKIKRSISEISP